MKIMLNDNGNITTLVEGAENELLQYWDENKRDLCGWMLEGDFPTAEEQKEATEAWEEKMDCEPQTAEELQSLFDELDHDWWTVEVK